MSRYKGRMISCARFRPFEDVDCASASMFESRLCACLSGKTTILHSTRIWQDVCCVGHSDGFGSRLALLGSASVLFLAVVAWSYSVPLPGLIVPGAGKANFDSFEAAIGAWCCFGQDTESGLDVQ